MNLLYIDHYSGLLEYQWVKTLIYAENSFKRALTMFQFCWKLWSKAQNIVADFNPDVVLGKICQ